MCPMFLLPLKFHTKNYLRKKCNKSFFPALRFYFGLAKSKAVLLYLDEVISNPKKLVSKNCIESVSALRCSKKVFEKIIFFCMSLQTP